MSIINTWAKRIPTTLGSWAPPPSNLPAYLDFDVYQDDQRQSIMLLTSPNIFNLLRPSKWSISDARAHFPEWMLRSTCILANKNTRIYFTVAYHKSPSNPQTGTLDLTFGSISFMQSSIDSLYGSIQSINQTVTDLTQFTVLNMNTRPWSNPFPASASLLDINIQLIKSGNLVTLVFPVLNPEEVVQVTPESFLSLRPTNNSWPDGQWPAGFRPKQTYFYLFPNFYDPALERHVAGGSAGSGLTAGYPLDQPKLRILRTPENGGEVLRIYGDWKISTPAYLPSWYARWPTCCFTYVVDPADQ